MKPRITRKDTDRGMGVHGLVPASVMSVSSVVCFILLFPCAVFAAGGSLADTSLALPGVGDVLQVLMMRDYNTRVVMLGASLLGAAAGIVGSFMLLRRRALLGDAVSHATLPGIAIAFMVMTALGGTGKFLPGLLFGALLSGLAGMGLILLIRSQTRLKEDVALGVVLSVFFGFGVALLGIIQKMKQGHAAGLESFIYGKTASMLASDAWLIAGVAASVVALCALFFKEFKLLCFDQDYATAQGWPVRRMDALMMALVVLVTVIGLQAVGLILVIALLIVPASAARFWTNRLGRMVVLAALIGGASSLLGAAASALAPRMPAGAIIVTTACGIFLFSMVFAPERGALTRWLEQVRLNLNVERQHLLRAMYEWHENAVAGEPAGSAQEQRAVPISYLLQERSWSPARLRRVVRRAERRGLVYRTADRGLRLTEEGWIEARRVVRNHRLWEMYLITYADIAPSHVDRGADEIEHVLGRAMAEKLEGLVAARADVVPASPHPLRHE